MIDFIRPNIRNLKAYTSARHENLEGILLDANENPFSNRKGNVELNRYPDPNQSKLKNALSKSLRCLENQLTISSGSDEAFDIIFKTILNTGDRILSPYPTYGMYQVLSDIYDFDFVKTEMDDDYQPIIADIKENINDRTKCIILCHPSNPVGNLIELDRIKAILDLGIPTIIDEAYIDFAIENSTLSLLKHYDNLIITRTFSKAYASAAIRCGFVIASEEFTSFFNTVKLPYNVNSLSLDFAIEALNQDLKPFLNYIEKEKKKLEGLLIELKLADAILNSVTNFLTFTTAKASEFYEFIKIQNIVLRKMSSIPNAIRITIGTEEEMASLYAAMKNYAEENRNA